jgi:redox-sensitive bicupin YhaK (pirin superfamily)
MTAGRGVVHAEERIGRSPVHIVQLWVAQPDATRDGPAAFEHHDDLPRVEFGDSRATVLVGGLGDHESPARRDSDHVGVDLELRSDATIPIRPEHEHALIPLAGTIEVDGRRLDPTQLVYLAPGREEIDLRPDGAARALLLGGAPFEEPVLMWWNYVARTHAEITEAHAAWTERSDRFAIPRSTLAPIDVGQPPWATKA